MALLMICWKGYLFSWPVPVESHSWLLNACPLAVKKALNHVDGVHAVEIDYESKIATVTFDDTVVTTAKLTEATTNAGYPSTVKKPWTWKARSWNRPLHVRIAAIMKPKQCSLMLASTFMTANSVAFFLNPKLGIVVCSAPTLQFNAPRSNSRRHVVFLKLVKAYYKQVSNHAHCLRLGF